MPSIRTIQSRDVQFLADSFPDKEEAYFNALHIDHLQDKCHTLVITDTATDGERHYLGYGCVYWQSTQTQLWRRNIPEITDISADDALLGELLHHIETTVQQKGLAQISIAVSQGAFGNGGKIG